MAVSHDERTPPLSDALASVLARYERGDRDSMPRKAGRPTKRTEDYYRNLLAAHHQACRWYEREHGTPPRSDVQLYTVYFERWFADQGLRAVRATEAAFQSRLKTLRNELSEARRLARTSLKSGCFRDGCDGNIGYR